jgi:hypothetical protein
MVSGLDRTGAAVDRGSDLTAIYRFIAAAGGAKYCLPLARSNAGVVANVRAVEMFARDRSAAFEENMESSSGFLGSTPCSACQRLRRRRLRGCTP